MPANNANPGDSRLCQHRWPRPRWSAPPGYGDSRSAPPGGGRSHPAPQRTPRCTHRPSASIRRATSRTISSISDPGAEPSRPAGSGTTVSMGVPSQSAFQRQPLLETSTTRSPGRYTPFLMPFPADPQVSSIARRRRIPATHRRRSQVFSRDDDTEVTADNQSFLCGCSSWPLEIAGSPLIAETAPIRGPHGSRSRCCGGCGGCRGARPQDPDLVGQQFLGQAVRPGEIPALTGPDCDVVEDAEAVGLAQVHVRRGSSLMQVVTKQTARDPSRPQSASSNWLAVYSKVTSYCLSSRGPSCGNGDRS